MSFRVVPLALSFDKMEYSLYRVNQICAFLQNSSRTYTVVLGLLLRFFQSQTILAVLFGESIQPRDALDGTECRRCR